MVVSSKVLICLKYLPIEFPTGEVPHYTKKQLFLKYNERLHTNSLHILKEIEVSPKNPEILYELVATWGIESINIEFL